VNAILGRLTRAGIVLAERQGNAVLYQANRDHLGWAVVKALAGMRRSALDAMRAEIASWQTAPVTALCLGSFARGEGDEDSDVDLLVVRPSDLAELDDTWDRQQQALRDLVQRSTGGRRRPTAGPAWRRRLARRAGRDRCRRRRLLRRARRAVPRPSTPIALVRTVRPHGVQMGATSND